MIKKLVYIGAVLPLPSLCLGVLSMLVLLPFLGDKTASDIGAGIVVVGFAPLILATLIGLPAYMIHGMYQDWKAGELWNEN